MFSVNVGLYCSNSNLPKEICMCYCPFDPANVIFDTQTQGILLEKTSFHLPVKKIILWKDNMENVYIVLSY